MLCERRRLAATRARPRAMACKVTNPYMGARTRHHLAARTRRRKTVSFLSLENGPCFGRRGCVTVGSSSSEQLQHASYVTGLIARLALAVHVISVSPHWALLASCHMTVLFPSDPKSFSLRTCSNRRTACFATSVFGVYVTMVSISQLQEQKRKLNASLDEMRSKAKRIKPHTSGQHRSSKRDWVLEGNCLKLVLATYMLSDSSCEATLAFLEKLGRLRWAVKKD